MSQSSELIDRYFAVWNERDTARRRDLIAQTWAEDASYLDPLMQGQSHAGIDSMVQGVQQQFAGHHFRQLGAVDAHNDRLRFSWELISDDGPVVVAGTDFGVVAADGRLQSVTGFLDQVPATASAE
ncbi:MAG: nuclear transport factor 2 family protein [Chloroflexi bacterium]|nr:nuclear transport factor 2 family protein [Chloroflexota bacterium]